MQATLSPVQESGLAFGLFSKQGEGWLKHVSARVHPISAHHEHAPKNLDRIRARLSPDVTGQHFYNELELNIQIGHICRIVQTNGQGRFLPGWTIDREPLVTPALLDAGFNCSGITDEVTDVCVPVEWPGSPFDLAQPACHAVLQPGITDDLVDSTVRRSRRTDAQRG
jgi:hypothetical protein